MNAEQDSAATAREQLAIAERARRSATRPRAGSPLLAPVAGLLMAAGFVWFALAVVHPGQSVYLLVGVGCLLAFLALALMSSRAGGLVMRPAGSLRRRIALQAVVAVPIVLGGIAAIFFGLAGSLIAVGVGLGIAAAVQIDQSRRGGTR